MIRFAPPFILALCLAACGAQPAHEFYGAERYTATRDGHDYVLLRKGNRFEIIRLGYATSGQHRDIRETMIRLVPDLTGCQVKSKRYEGDSGEMRGKLDCRGPR